MPLTLEMTIRYDTAIFSGDPGCDELIGWVDTAPVFDVGRAVVSALHPRKRFATDFGITVGSVRSGKFGQCYVGPRQVAEGVDKLAGYLSRRQLRNYDAHYWGPPMKIDVGVMLARPATKSLLGWFESVARASVVFEVAAAEPWAAETGDQVFELFVRGLQIAPPRTAHGSWWNEHSNIEFERAISHARPDGTWPVIPGYRYLLYLPPGAVTALGGADAVVGEAPVFDAVKIVHGDEIGVATRLCRGPADITDALLHHWREYLRPVVELAPDLTPAERLAGGRFADRVSLIPCPLDLLPSDFYGMDQPPAPA